MRVSKEQVAGRIERDRSGRVKRGGTCESAIAGKSLDTRACSGCKNAVSGNAADQVTSSLGEKQIPPCIVGEPGWQQERDSESLRRSLRPPTAGQDREPECRGEP